MTDNKVENKCVVYGNLVLRKALERLIFLQNIYGCFNRPVNDTTFNIFCLNGDYFFLRKLVFELKSQRLQGKF